MLGAADNVPTFGGNRPEPPPEERAWRNDLSVEDRLRNGPLHQLRGLICREGL